MFSMPGGWRSARFGDLQLEAQNGCGARAGTGTPTVVLRLADVDTDGTVAKEGLRLVGLSAVEIERYALTEGDLLAFRVNGSRDIAGQVIRYRGPTGFAYCDHFIRFRLDTSVVSPAFVAEAFRVPSVRRQVEVSMVSSAGQNTVSQGSFREVEIPLPPLNEQRRIVRKLESLQSQSRRTREALEAVPPLLEKLRQSILAAAFRGDLTKQWRAKHPDAEAASVMLLQTAAGGAQRRRGREVVARARGELARPENLPATWVLGRMADVAPLQPGYAFKSSEFSTKGVRLLRGINIVPDATRWADTVFLSQERVAEFSEYELRAGDLVIAMDRPIISTGIKVARLTDGDIPALLLQRVGRFQARDGVRTDYLFHFIRSAAFIRHIWGQATGTQLPHVSSTDVGSVLVPIPPLKEQQAIAERCDEALAVLAALEARLRVMDTQVAELAQTLLAKAFRGELVLQDPSGEPPDRRATGHALDGEQSKESERPTRVGIRMT